MSLSGAKGIYNALETLGHTVTLHDPAHSLSGLPEAVKGKDFAFINLHGSPGEDGIVQAMLERLGCPYQGAGPAASMLALDKAVAKTLFRLAGLNIAPSVLLSARPNKGWQPELAYPLFVKSNTGGSSLHMEKVEQPKDLDAALDRLFPVNAPYLVESAVSGQEVTCGILGRLENGVEIPEALPTVLIRPATGDIFDYASKYTPGGAEELCPAPLPDALNKKIQEMALAAHRILGITGYSRADLIVPEQGDPVLLEVNTLPGMTSTSLIPQEAAAVGMSYADLVQRLIELGIARHGR